MTIVHAKNQIFILSSAELHILKTVEQMAFSTQVRGFKPGRSRRIFKGRKNPQHAFLRRGSKAVGPMS